LQERNDRMNNIIQINYETENPTVSARDLHDGLEIKTAFKDWFPRMSEFGFDEGKDFCSKKSESTGGRPLVDYEISVDMAKQICMIQRTEKGREYRQYFLDLEKAWNTPDQIIARALKMANHKIDELKSHNTILIEDVQRMKPKEIFADAVSASKTSILVGEMAKLLCQNGVDIGEKRFFKWLRNNGYLIKGGRSDHNAPTQKSVKMGIIERKETVFIDGEGVSHVKPTPKVTTKGQQYFINKLLGDNQEVI
jgi:anti-repressor protein